MNTNNPRRRRMITCLIVFLLFTLSFASYTPRLLTAWQATRWSECQAVVTESRYERFIHPQFHTCTEKPRFEYTYVLDGKRYWSSRVDASLREKLAEGVSFIDALPVGSEISIQVNPADPSDAVLKPPTSLLATTLGPILFLGFTACSWCLRKRSSPDYPG